MGCRNCFFLLCLLITTTAVSQKNTVPAQPFPNLKFAHLDINSGLSISNVNYTLRDRRGIMWLATPKGLNRYDGSLVKVYRHRENDSTTICSDLIFTIAEDREGMLWLCTEKGLCRFNPYTGKARNYYHEPGNANSLSDNYQTVPFIDSRGRLWLATPKGVQLFDYQRNQFTTWNMPPLPKPEWQLHANEFRLVTEDRQHRIWAFTFFGLYRVNEPQHVLEPYYAQQFLANICYLQTRNGEHWLGLWSGGIRKFEPEQNRYTQHPNVVGDVVTSLCEWQDNEGNNWIAAGCNSGLLLLNPVTGEKKLYGHTEKDPQSLASFSVLHICKDPENRLWISGDKGVDIVDPALQNFTNYRLYHSLETENPQNLGTPRAFIETGNGYMLAAWYQRPLYFFDKNWNLKNQVKRIPPSSPSLYSGCINTLWRDEKGNTWYGTDSGLVKQTGSRYTVYIPPGASSMSRGDFVIRNMIKRPDGQYWVRALNSGMLVFDANQGRFTRFYKLGENGLHGALVAAVFDNRQQLWAGGDEGLFFFDEANDRFVQVPLGETPARDPFLNMIYDLYCDRNGILWAATRNGLARIHTVTKAVQVFGQRAGLTATALQRILEDSTGKLWISADEGIIQFDKKNTFRFFGQPAGMAYERNEAVGVFRFNNSGKILFGTTGIITEFNPYSLKINTQPPPALFVSCTVNDTEKEIDTANGENRVYLAPGENTAVIHFAVPDYTSAAQNKYYYQVNGLHQHWQEAQNGNVYLTQLSPGTYTLRVRGQNSAGIYSHRYAVLLLIVKPRWYQTLLFKIGCVAFLLGIITVLYRWRIRSVKKAAELKQKIAETEMLALRAQMSPHFIFNSLNSIENFIMQNNKRQASDYLNKFSRLIRVILDNSRSEWVPVEKDLGNLQLYIDLELLRFNNKFRYTVHAEEQLLNNDYRVPSLLVQPYLENAILHGIAHSERENLQLLLNIRLEGDYITYAVRDNGVGRKQAEAYKQQNKPGHKSVGLQITAERLAFYNNGSGRVVINDLTDDAGRPAGTEVIVQIKYQ